jgi:hypothetical protein
MFLSAFATLHDPASRTDYDKCRARGKTHIQALLRLARHPSTNHKPQATWDSAGSR